MDVQYCNSICWQIYRENFYDETKYLKTVQTLNGLTRVKHSSQ